MQIAGGKKTVSSIQMRFFFKLTGESHTCLASVSAVQYTNYYYYYLFIFLSRYKRYGQISPGRHFHIVHGMISPSPTTNVEKLYIKNNYAITKCKTRREREHTFLKYQKYR